MVIYYYGGAHSWIIIVSNWPHLVDELINSVLRLYESNLLSVPNICFHKKGFRRGVTLFYPLQVSRCTTTQYAANPSLVQLTQNGSRLVQVLAPRLMRFPSQQPDTVPYFTPEIMFRTRFNLFAAQVLYLVAISSQVK